MGKQTFNFNFFNFSDPFNNSDILIPGSTSLYYPPGDLKSNDGRICWANYQISRLSMYRTILIVFALIFGPLVFCEMQKTKYLQIFTTVFRWMGALPQKK